MKATRIQLTVCFLGSCGCLPVFQSLCQQIKTQLKSYSHWKAVKALFGNTLASLLSQVTAKYLAIPATSVTCERDTIQHSWPHRNRKTGMSSAARCQHVGLPRWKPWCFV